MMSNDSSSVKVPRGQTPLTGCERQHVLRRLIMDEEYKKIIAGLHESVRAMQAEIQTLKNTHESKATHSGINLPAGSQYSDLVPGSDLLPNKRQKLFLKGPVRRMRRRKMTLRSVSAFAVPMTSSRCLKLLVHSSKPLLILN